MVKFSQIAAASLPLAVVLASAQGFKIYHKDDLAVETCETLLTKSAKLFPSKDKKKYCNVDNQPALGSMAHCVSEIPYKHSVEAFIKSCSKFGLTRDQFGQAYDNATKYIINPKKEPGFNKTKLSYKPVMVPQKKLLGGWHSAIGRYMNFNRSHWYGIVLLSYWFVVLFVAGICNYAYFLFPGVVKSTKGKFVNNFRKYITLPATFKKMHAEHVTFLRIFQWLVPTRLETILLVAWFAMALGFNVSNYAHDKPNLYWPDMTAAEMGMKIADRTGIIVLYIIPQLILFAGRNNFMLWFSGWHYSRFVEIHKWLARASFLLVVVHAVGMTYNGKAKPGKYERRNTEEYVRWGYVSLVAASIMVFHSLLVLRKTRYELFVLTHIILACLFIIGGWRHCEERLFAQYFIAAVAVWVFDRVLRLGRLFAFGVRKAEVELKANETVKVTVTRPKYWKPFPGCYAFIHFVRPTCFWQSHPFTIVEDAVNDNTITFYLKVKGGVTHGLYQYLSKQPGHRATIKVLVEGPYGQRTAIDKFDNAVFFAGGNGVPGLYYEAKSLCQRAVDKQRVKFYWVIRHYKSLEWFYEELLKFKDTRAEVVIYVTQAQAGLVYPIGEDASSETEEKSASEDAEEKKNEVADGPMEDYSESLKKQLSFIEFREGRPSAEELVRTELAEAHGSIGFATCAHGSMVDDTRRAIAKHINTTNHRVDLFEQMQIW